MKTILIVSFVIAIIFIVIHLRRKRRKLQTFQRNYKKANYSYETKYKKRPKKSLKRSFGEKINQRCFDFFNDDSNFDTTSELNAENSLEDLSEHKNSKAGVCFALIKNEKHSDLLKYSDYVNTFLSELQTGYLHFTPPERMKLGKQITLEAILAKQIDLFKKSINLDDLDTLPVATEMGVKLEGDSFEIKELTQQYKIISNSEPTSWFWKIKPTSTGAQDIYLTVSIKLKFENYSDATKEIPMYIKTIKVTVNPIYSIKHFFSNNWKWIISTFFGSGIVFVLLKLFKIID